MSVKRTPMTLNIRQLNALALVVEGELEKRRAPLSPDQRKWFASAVEVIKATQKTEKQRIRDAVKRDDSCVARLIAEGLANDER